MSISISDENLNNILEFYTPDSVYIVGSSINHIVNYNDIDVLVLFKNNDDYLKKNIRKSFLEPDGKRIEVFVNTYERQFSMTINKYYAWTSLNMAKHIYGDDLLQIYDFNKYNLINSKPYRQTLCKYIKNEFMCVRKRFFVSKNDFTTNPRRGSNYLWKCYRLLLICYIINNNSYNLTNEQIKMLNKVHDEKDMSEELWAWCENIIETEAL